MLPVQISLPSSQKAWYLFFLYSAALGQAGQGAQSQAHALLTRFALLRWARREFTLFFLLVSFAIFECQTRLPTLHCLPGLILVQQGQERRQDK